MESDIGFSAALTSPETVALSPRMASTGGSREAAAGAPTVEPDLAVRAEQLHGEKICRQQL